MSVNIEAAELFRALSDQTRLRCLVLLVQHEELCVCELTQALALPQPKVSHHLSNLRRAGLVSDRKSGLWVHYRINPALPAWVAKLLQTTTEGVAVQAPFAADRAALAEMPNRNMTSCSV